MKGIFTALILMVLLAACKEGSIAPAKPATFVHYYNNGNAYSAVDVIETSDEGFLIVANSSPASGDGWIEMIKTDRYGNHLWTMPYKSKASTLVASNVVATQDNSGKDVGYVLVGSRQNASIGSQLFVLRAGTTGTIKDSATYNFKSSGFFIKGSGVAQSTNATADFFVVGGIFNSDLVTHQVQDMFFAQISGSNLDTVFTRKYGAGSTQLAGRLFLGSNQQNAYWGGTRIDSYGTHMGLINSGFVSKSSIFSITYPTGDLTHSVLGNDFSVFGYSSYNFVGSQQPKSGGNYNAIVFARLDQGGNAIDSVRHLTLKNSQAAVPANSVCASGDGGVLILGTLAIDAQGTNTDYYLIKLDANGKEQWARTQGGKYLDTGVRVLQAADGGYVVLGTTTLANVNSVLLMKTDGVGNIE